MAKFRKIVEVDAVQWKGLDEGPHDLGVVEIECCNCPYDDDNVGCFTINCTPELRVPAETTSIGWIPTLKGGHVVSEGDWIITGIQGEKYPVKSDIFAQTYVPIVE